MTLRHREGLGRRHFGEVNIFNKIGAFFKLLHPERNTRLFIIRAPGIFPMVWGAVKKMLDQRTVDKINILGRAELAPLLQALGPEVRFGRADRPREVQ